MDRVSKAERELVRMMKKQTNADRIRQMSDEELADVLDHVQGDAFLVGVGQRKNSLYPGAGVSWIDWLKQEVESDE